MATPAFVCKTNIRTVRSSRQRKVKMLTQTPPGTSRLIGVSPVSPTIQFCPKVAGFAEGLRSIIALKFGAKGDPIASAAPLKITLALKYWFCSLHDGMACLLLSPKLWQNIHRQFERCQRKHTQLRYRKQKNRAIAFASVDQGNMKKFIIQRTGWWQTMKKTCTL